MAGDDALVVEVHHRDHVFDVRLGLDAAGAEARPAREDRVIVDPPLVEQGAPDLPGKAEMGDAVSVQVADLPAAQLERELPRFPYPAVTPGQEVTSWVICSLGLCSIVMAAPRLPLLVSRAKVQVEVRFKSRAPPTIPWDAYVSLADFALLADLKATRSPRSGRWAKSIALDS